MLKIGILGAGHLGKIHIRCVKEISQYSLQGFYDPDDETAENIQQENGIHRFNSIEDAIEACDVIDIVTPTTSHFDVAVQCLRSSKNVFIEKPLADSIEQATELVSLAREANVKVQVGHVERFNPAFLAALPYFESPMFIETHRLAQFNPRGTDVSVVLDLMIHDIDVILSVVKSNVKKISASGVAVVSDNPDIANARLEFDNGCVANLTASRISIKNMRKSRFFQKNAYIAVDFLDKKTEIIRMKDLAKKENADPFAMVLELGKNKGYKEVIFDKPEVKPLNAIQTELETFADAIINNKVPAVTIEDGFEALSVAHRILDKINTSLSAISV